MRPPRKGASKARAPVRKPRVKPKPARKPAPGPRSEPPDYSIAAVERALDLLDALARTGPATLVVLAAQAKCTRSNAFRLLRTLQSRGFAIQDEARGVWRLGARWAMLGRASHDQGAMAATAASFLAALGQAVGENAYLRTRDNLAAETVAVYQAEPGLRLYSEPGTRSPLHAGPSRLLLAYAPEAVQTQVLTQRLPRFTPATRTDPNWIAADLQRIRSRGFLITSDEVHPGAVSITAPIWDAGGHVVAALTVSGPSMRMRPPRPRSLLPQLLETARRLSAALGGSAPERVPESHASAQPKAPPRSHVNPPAPAALR